MPTYRTPLEDMRFVLHDLLDVAQLGQLPGYEEVTQEVVDAVLSEGARLAETVLQPLNQSGDAAGCRFENGVVRTPQGFPDAYARYAAGGWPGLACEPAYGGQGLPHVLGFVMDEVLSAANMAFEVFPGLTHGAYNTIAAHGDQDLKATYLPKLADGSWTGTMCLTEPQCGTDLGLIRTRAAPRPDGSYAVTGSKIFISAGEHDLAENIVHLVLARLPDAPPGTRGISLFVVPKFLPQIVDDTVRPGMRNGIVCGAIEHKMGLHGSPTCAMNLEEATGWLVGEPHRGLSAMFTMMNAARLVVGLQGLGIAEVSYQNARDYARQRLQGRALGGAKYPDRPADPIIVHPDVRRSLLTMKAFVEGARAFAYWVALEIDREARHPDPEVRAASADLVALATPVVKAFLTDGGFETASLAVQVFGGYGYIRDSGVEQFVRDARVTQIYEGANGIQALDLVGRKVPQATGRLLRRFFHPIDQFMREQADDPAMAEFVCPLGKAFAALQQATLVMAGRGLADPEEAGAAATDYLRLFGLVALAYMWVRMAATARAKMRAADGNAAFYESKIKTARFYMQKVLPQSRGLLLAILAGAQPLMDLDADAF